MGNYKKNINQRWIMLNLPSDNPMIFVAPALPASQFLNQTLGVTGESPCSQGMIGMIMFPLRRTCLDMFRPIGSTLHLSLRMSYRHANRLAT